MADTDYADYLALLANKPAHIESLLHSLAQAAKGIGFSVYTNKREQMCFKQKRTISTLSGIPLKLVDQFTHLGSNISSIEIDVNIRLVKELTTSERLSILWKFDLSDKMIRDFFQAVDVSILLFGCTKWTLTKHLEEKLDGNYERMLRAVLNNSWKQHPTKQQLYSYLTSISQAIKDEQDIQGTVKETKMNSREAFSYEFLHMVVPFWAD